MVFMRSLFVEFGMSSESWVYGYNLEPVIFLTMKIVMVLKPKEFGSILVFLEEPVPSDESIIHYLIQMLLAIN